MLYRYVRIRFSRFALVTLVIGILALILGSPTDSANAGSGILWGATMYGKAADSSQFAPNGSYTKFEQMTKKPLAIISWGAPWEYPKGKMLPFQRAYFDNVRNHGSIPFLSWGSWSCCGTIQPQYTLAKVTSGKYDAFIRQWATDAKNWGHPFMLRFDWEMNGWWQFPWAVQINGNKAKQFVSMWRHVHDIFTKVGANNVTWVWCPNIVSNKTTKLSQLYPGDNYVDWTCLDGYNWYKDHGEAWMSFSDLFTASYNEITKVAPSKPVIIGEFASVEARDGGAKKAAWIKDAFSVIPTKFPKIKAVIWFNWNDNAGLTWPIESSGKSQAAFASAISSSNFLSNTFNTLNETKVFAH